MRSALAWMSVLTLLAFACHGEDCECEKEAAKGETKPPAAEAPAAGPAAPPAAPAGVGEAPAEAAPPPDEIGWDRAQRLLQPLGRPLEYVKLTLQPERLAALGASDFHAFALADPGILLYVAEFPTPGAAAARAGGVAPSLQGWGLLVPTAAALNGHLVLVAGHGGDTGASPAALDMARRAGEAFGAAVELLPPTGEIPAPDTVIQSPTPHPQDVAADFIVKAEAELLPLWIAQERASWVAATYITDDTELMAADAAERVMEFVSRAAAETRRFQDLDLSGEPVLARKLHLLRIANPLPAPADPARRAELARIAAAMQGAYGKARGCLPAEAGSEARCLPLGELDEIIGTSRDPRALADAWTAWHDAATPLKDDYARYVELANEGAREMGFENLGDLWKSGYDMSPEAFQAETERLWGQLEPFYRDLHCFVRGRLRELHGTGVVPADGPIPAHLLGNMWAQDWTALYDLLVPEPGGEAFDLTGALVDRGVDPERMVRYAEAFFVSLGLPALPETFWTRSMLTKPRDREVVCHASAWDIDWQDDLRIKMCIRINEEDFSTIHHELGHNYYQRAYKAQPTLFTNSANDGFHEALGDTISLSVTPAYLRQVQLMPEGEAVSDLNPLMRKALEKIAFLPFGLLIDRWRWEVFAGRVAPADFNSAWWELRRRFQGVAPPAARGADAFDPGAKYHIPANVPYTRYFLAAVLQFQFHRALCRVAGHQGPLHTCSIYGSRVAGERLEKMMAMGLSQPWPDALEVLTGEREMDASAIVEYFAPLSAWIREQNAQRGFACGW